MESCLPRVMNIAARIVAFIAVTVLSAVDVTAREGVPTTELYARGHLDNKMGLWTFEGRAGQTVEVEVKSDDFATVVGLISPTGDLLSDDDDGGIGTNSRLVATLPADGVYQLLVEVHLFDAADGGVYDVTVREASGGESLLTLGTTEHSTLDSERPETGLWTFEGRAGQTVEVEVKSDDFATVVGLISPTGDLLSADDDGGIGTNSRLVATLPADGVYQGCGV